jgi:hypothetical protein
MTQHAAQPDLAAPEAAELAARRYILREDLAAGVKLLVTAGYDGRNLLEILIQELQIVVAVEHRQRGRNHQNQNHADDNGEGKQLFSAFLAQGFFDFFNKIHKHPPFA